MASVRTPIVPLVILSAWTASVPAAAQSSARPAHDMQHMHMEDGEQAMPPARNASGTSWMPDDSPMYALQTSEGRWMLMAHGSARVQFLHETGDRGSSQFGSINWLMGMAARELAGGRLELHAMVSLEPWTIRGCGYPDLLAS